VVRLDPIPPDADATDCDRCGGDAFAYRRAPLKRAAGRCGSRGSERVCIACLRAERDALVDFLARVA
jgi:hypothetical protein